MKYLIVAGLCLAGILAISVRNTDLKEIADIPRGMVTTVAEAEEIAPADPAFDEYWYAGLAEISGYALQQSRYGELHSGTATMIFVTEPFSRSKQVKLDNPGNAGADNVSVLKLNFTRKFLTGIYPYSMMTSVFNPVNTEAYNAAMKLTLSGQEWCGQVFMQLNKDGGGYDAKSFSYFESEGDQFFETGGKAYLEDELFNLIRLNPELLPKGEVEVIPSAVVNRFMHEELKPYKAMARSEQVTWKGMNLNQYTLKYEHNGRILNIYYQDEFPHLIEGWEDTYSGFRGEPLTSVATRKNTKQLDYWNKNNNKDRSLNSALYK